MKINWGYKERVVFFLFAVTIRLTNETFLKEQKRESNPQNFKVLLEIDSLHTKYNFHSCKSAVRHHNS